MNIFTASRVEEENENKNNNTMDDDDEDIGCDADVTMSTRHLSCVTCRKRFSSPARLEVHCQSHRHQQQRHSVTSGNPFRLLEPLPPNIIASLSPLSSPPRTSLLSASPKSSPNDAITSSTSGSKKERSFRVSQPFTSDLAFQRSREMRLLVLILNTIDPLKLY